MASVKNDYRITPSSKDGFRVLIDWASPKATVYFQYGAGEKIAAPFKTEDFHITKPDATLRRVRDYAERA
jgi:hypothetical protein